MTARRLALALLAAALAAPAPAAAGGFATVGVEPLPTATGPWSPTVTVLQHGRTPAEGLRPEVTITGPGGATRTATAVATAEPGVYRARLEVPAAGRWAVSVDEGFGMVHRVGTATVDTPAHASAAASAATGDDGPPWAAIGAALAAGALAGLATAALQRRRPRGLAVDAG